MGDIDEARLRGRPEGRAEFFELEPSSVNPFTGPFIRDVPALEAALAALGPLPVLNEDVYRYWDAKKRIWAEATGLSAGRLHDAVAERIQTVPLAEVEAHFGRALHAGDVIG